MKPVIPTAVFLLTSATVLMTSVPAELPVDPSAEIYMRISAEAEEIFQKHILHQWFPRTIDRENGGFNEDYGPDWSPGPNIRKSVVYQSRLTWLSARAAARDPKRAEAYKEISRHGLKFLETKQWDRKEGGMYWAVDRAGNPDPGGNYKHSYGLSFAIFGAAANYEVTRDNEALELAKTTFFWLDEHGHDNKYGGYFDLIRPAGSSAGGYPAGARADRKSTNTLIHVLEAFTQLYSVWPDEHVRKRTEEILDICVNKLYRDPGYLVGVTSADWTPEPARDSYGHDIETGYLVVEAAAALGKPDDQRIWAVARNLVDHGLDVGFDEIHGGFYDAGTPAGRISATEKVWWVQAEGLNVLLLMHERFEKETQKYWNAFVKQWDFIRNNQIDYKYGGWYPRVHANGRRIRGRQKSNYYTEGYHQGRAMMNIVERLHRLAEESMKQAKSKKQNGRR